MAHAQGRTTVLKINDQNTHRILQTTSLIAADLLSAAHQEGHAWGDMAMICRDYATMDVCAHALQYRKLSHQVRKRSGDYHPSRDTITVLTMHVCKGLEFPVVALPGIGHMPAAGTDEQEEARLFYVAATRATHRLVITASGMGDLEGGWSNDKHDYIQNWATCHSRPLGRSQ